MQDDAVFIDSNILVYAFDKNEATKHKKAKKLLEKCFTNEIKLVASTQVLSEFFVNATKKIEKPITVEDARNIVEKIIEFKGFSVLVIKPNTIKSAIDTSKKTGAHYWDSLIAETMKENKVFEILTENTKDFKKINWLNAKNPF